ncbi:MAG: hydrogenase maturation protease [Planctomycetales bacterium]|nr:hydrogenase maturation protease [Planctomycetales bacterium]
MTRGIKQIEVLVAGLGNELLTDDGVGVHIVRMLQKEPPAKGVVFAEAGTAILHSQDLLEQACHVIAIDAVQTGGNPGALYLFDVDQAKLNHPATLHELGIVGVSKLIPEHARPAVTILGVEPEKIDYGMTLSPAVQDAVPRAARIVREIIAVLTRKAGCRAGFAVEDIDVRYDLSAV